MSDLPEIDPVDFDQFQADLAHYVDRVPTSVDFAQPPSADEWERVNDYRRQVEQIFQSLPPDRVAIHDQMVENFSRQMVRLGLDLSNPRVLYTTTLVCSMLTWFLLSEAAMCQSNPGDVMAHINRAMLRFDYVIRRALVNAGAPETHAPATPDPEA